MKYDFDTVIDRRGTHSEKWDGMEYQYGVSPDDGISMWVADMEFRPPPEVNEALGRAVDHGIYGYPGDLDSYHEAILNWMERRHNWLIEPQWISTTHGIVNAVNLLVQAFCKPGDKVIIQPPVYYPFFGAVINNGCRIVENQLIEVDGRYEMDFDDLERQADKNTRLMILCSPHNPGGQIWNRNELERLAEFCLSRGIIIISDEIHHDLVYEGYTHSVLASLDTEIARKVITCTSASKTFNLAGTMTGNVIITNDSLRRRFRNQMAKCGINAPNVFGLLAAKAAYTHGAPWLDELLVYLQGNRDLVYETVKSELPDVDCMRLEGTYLAWLDFTDTGLSMDEIVRQVQSDARLALNHGPTFGSGGEKHLRLNFACPRSMLEEGLKRMVGVFG